MKYAIIAAVSFAAGIILASTYYSKQIQDSKKSEEQVKADAKAEAVAAYPLKDVPQDHPCLAISFEKLSAPKFSSKMPPQLQTNRQFEVKVEWDAVKGAKAYNIFLETKDGKPLKKYTTKSTSMTLRDVPLPIEAKEVEYAVRIATVNGIDKLGEKGEARPLKVNRQGSVMAPTLKTIEVED